MELRPPAAPTRRRSGAASSSSPDRGRSGPTVGRWRGRLKTCPDSRSRWTPWSRWTVDGDALRRQGCPDHGRGLRDRQGDRADEVAREIEQRTEGHAVAVQADVSIGADVARMVSDVTSRLGPTDVLVNNAAIA